MELTSVETRVLGALMEKAVTTPDVYPLTLNATVHACNQKTSRDPVTDFDEDEVLDALEQLRSKHLATRVDMAGSRTAKFRENASRHWELEREEYALLSTLLLRGPQTPGQLRQRSERLFPFAELQQVTDWLGRLQKREDEPHTLVQSLGRSPGTKEIRYTHTLSPIAVETAVATETLPATTPPPQPGGEPETNRFDKLEETISHLQERVAKLEELLDDLIS